MHTLRSTILAATILGSGGIFSGAIAQQAAPQPAPPITTAPATPPANAPATRPSGETRAEPVTPIVAAGALERGANSFTEGQAKSRFEEAGFTDVTALAKDEAGFWRARGMRGGIAVDLAMDFRGRIAAGPEAGMLPREAPSAARPATPAPATTTR